MGMDYKYPEPTALQSTTDPNQTVKLHGLCTVCQHVVDDFRILISDPHHDVPYDTFGRNYAAERKHHRSVVELEASSEKGCHLCNILWARLQVETSELESLRLLESHLRTASMRSQDTVSHSYALRLFTKSPRAHLVSLALYHPPKYHEFYESEELSSFLKTCPSNYDPVDVCTIDIYTIECLCTFFINRQAFEC